MACNSDIAKNIISDCTTQGVGGNEIKAWIGQRNDFSFTYDVTNPSKVTGITATSTKQLWTLTASKKAIDSGHDRVVEAGRADRFTHFIGFSGYEFKAEDVENFDSLSDLIVIVESKDKTDDGDGVFRGYGLKYGLDVLSDSHRANDANGSRPLEFGPTEGDSEPFSNYTILDTDYATTKDLLIALETPAV